MATEIGDFYGLLGVPRRATDDEIKRAYRKLARELHPDVNGGDPATEERFKLVTVAYETLRDPERRRRYDTFGPEGLRGTGAGGAGGAGGFEDLFGAGLGDLFNSFFGGGGGGFGQGRRGQAGPPRGADMEVTLDLDFRSAVFGASKEIRVRVPVPCSTCNATGAKPGTSATTCATCGGAGEVRQVRQSILGQMVTSRPCPRCNGLGKEITSPCPDCRGEGRRSEEKAYTVDIPAGVDDGNTLQLGGRGAAGPRGGAPGDLFVHLRVRPDERFHRQGNDLVHVLHVPMAQAALGAHIRYETLDGTEDLVIPRATQPGKVFRLRGRGVPDVNGRGRGDLLVQVVVDTPGELTKEQEDLLRLFAGARGEDVAPAESGFMAKVRSAFK
ncbi:MAG: molecular chaperone DnaJ [Gaiellaceae bacterium]|jgi:molecular chaperone DnaJ|nr:molecular chaperone DnaJ [Gaiellaceae bacterium]